MVFRAGLLVQSAVLKSSNYMGYPLEETNNRHLAQRDPRVEKSANWDDSAHPKYTMRWRAHDACVAEKECPSRAHDRIQDCTTLHRQAMDRTNEEEAQATA